MDSAVNNWQDALMVYSFSDICHTLSYFLCLTSVIESFFAGIYLVIMKLPKRIIGLVILANIILYPFAWLTFPSLPLPYEFTVFMVEVFAVLSEAVFMYLIARKIPSLATLSFRHAFAISFLMNMGSFLSGFIR